MALSAADLQKRHELEGAPDPFPSLADSTPSKPRTQPSTIELDTGSESAFPSLAPAAPSGTIPPASAWGSAAGPRIKASVHKNPVFTDSFTLSAIDLSNAGKDGKAASLGEVMKQVMSKYKVKLEASANQLARQTTFHIKAESEKELDKAKRNLLASLSPVTTVIMHAPASTIPSIIGPKGATLKQIRDQTGVRIDIPKKDTIPSVNGNGVAHDNLNKDVSQDDDEDEPTIPVTLSGPQPLVAEAQALINQMIAVKTSKTTQRVKDIPQHVLPFIVARRPAFMAAADDAEIKLTLNSGDREITVSGEREAVIRVVDVIRTTVENFKSNLTSVKIGLPKRQHRLLVGNAVEEILAKSKCTMVTAKFDEPGDDVTVWGMSSDLPGGLAAVMERANSKYIHEFPLPGPIEVSRQLLAYITRINFIRSLSASHPNVAVYLPSESAAEKLQSINLDIIGDKADVDSVVREISQLIGKLIGGIRHIVIDWLLHRVIIGKNAKKIKQYHDVHNVQVFFPSESAESSQVLLVYDPLSPSASLSPDEKKRHLDEVEKEILKMAKDAADVKTEMVPVAKRWHDSVVGRGGTTLNAIIGEDKTLSIKFGAEAGDPTTEDVIVVRGIAADVDRAVREILRIAKDAENDEIDNSYSTDFDIDREYVGRIVGAQGSGINRLREQLGVSLDVFDDTDDKEKEVGKRKKAVHQKSKVKITGRKENVEEAKKRILTQINRLADETSEIIKIPSQFHSSLIGQSGKYAIRLEEKYAVKITFPRQSPDGETRTREQLKPDEVLLKGGKKGVAEAKAELLDALEFEKEANNVLKFTVPTRSVARILGKGGASINEIKDNTDAQIDIDKATDDDAAVTNITVRGTKKAIAAAKASILAISEQVTEEVTISVVVETRFHRTLIGAGGQGLRELIIRAGGPSDPKLQAGLVRFPRQGEQTSDEVKLRGEPKLVNRIKAELEKVITALRDRVILAVEIPSVQHRALIGRGGQNLNELQDKLKVQIQFPGSRSYHQVGEPENIADFADVDPANIVKLSGPRASCESAITELKAQIKPPTPTGIARSVPVPLKYYHAVSQQGNLLRTLRSLGVQVEQSNRPERPAVPTRPIPSANSARIDQDQTTPEVEWEVIANYQDAEEGDSIWTLKARDEDALEKAEVLIKEAMEHAEKMSHVGFLTLADRSMFPRIVGPKGVNVARIRGETGADITVSRENNTIVIIGTESNIIAAKEAILKVTNQNRPPRRYQD